ncbi:antitoxin family protein [Longimicrobium sp.]|uniref:antitoxin family protein n=1 Tax=Longimicrobium sp. TaxID=2029185 RepID=UPI002F920714
MSQMLYATFDGEVLRPEGPVPLAPNTRVRVVIEETETAPVAPASFLDVAKSLDLNGPADWSTNLDEYLYRGKDLDRG